MSDTVLAPIVTPEQLDLVRRTVANGATSDELKLYLFDCARQGVHPLDKLLHFTKRQGKYTPITSIDFMRIRAAETGEYAGSGDPEFDGENMNQQDGGAPLARFRASVTVWRLVQGTRYPFTATARWSEYKPDAGPSGRGDVMWLKMPYTMLGKCAEALALRKGFPRQLAGLYAKEELDQAGANGPAYVVEPLELAPETPAKVSKQADEPSAVEQQPVLITKVEAGWAGSKAKGFLHHSGQRAGEDGIPIYKDQLVTLASECCQAKEPVMLGYKTPASGKPYVASIHRIGGTDQPEDISAHFDATGEVPF